MQNPEVALLQSLNLGLAYGRVRSVAPALGCPFHTNLKISTRVQLKIALHIFERPCYKFKVHEPSKKVKLKNGGIK